MSEKKQNAIIDVEAYKVWFDEVAPALMAHADPRWQHEYIPPPTIVGIIKISDFPFLSTISWDNRQFRIPARFLTVIEAS